MVGIFGKIMIGVLVWCVISLASFPFSVKGFNRFAGNASGIARTAMAIGYLVFNIPAIGTMYGSGWYFQVVVVNAGVFGVSGSPDEHRAFRNGIRSMFHLQPLPP